MYIWLKYYDGRNAVYCNVFTERYLVFTVITAWNTAGNTACNTVRKICKLPYITHR